MKIYVVGSLNMDLVVRAPRLPERGETLESGGFFRNPGGKGANQAVACAKLGAETYMVGCVGSAFGEELLSVLSGYGVNTEFVETHAEVASGVAVIVVEGGDNRILLDRGANALVSKELVSRALERAERGDILIVQLETDPALVTFALRLAKEKGLVTVLNPAPAKELKREAFLCSDYVVPNQTEAEFYTGVYPEDEESICVAARAFADMGASNVLITLGEKGSSYCSGEEFYHVEAYPVTAVDTTAAGDTYVGAFAVKLSEGAKEKDAMAFATKASALAVTRAGAQQSIPTRKEVEQLS